MKKQMIIVLAFMAALSSFATAQIPTNLQQAETLAVAQGKLILADFYTVW